ncbi:MAG: protein kinase domain-containing protein [Pyrinomonadaceae bacterium]
MPDSLSENLKEIFHAAVTLPTDKRQAFLDKACNNDLALRAAVESLLKSHEETGNFVDTPAYEVAAKMLAEEVELKAGQMVGHYRILSLLGEGGMGKVYLAEDTKLHRKVSLKFLSTNFTGDHDRLRRFEQEARAASALNHPNILTIHEIGEAQGHRFIATEYIEGQTLRDRLWSGAADIDDALEIAIQVASALVAAHRVHIVHRDIKPENIMIRKDDGLVKVLDFGLAKMTQRWQDVAVDSKIDTAVIANTAPGVVMGTVAYMSPEQARGDRVDERTDIWSLGVVLYEIVAGCSPFVAATSNEIISAILSKEAAQPLSRYARQVPERLEEIVEKALAKNRDERYQTSKDLLIDLKRFKQTLDLKAGIARSTSPEKFGVPTSDENLSDAKTSPLPDATPTISSASSAEYIVNQVKTHKRGVVVALAVMLLAIAIAVVIYGWRSGQTVAPAQQEIKSLAVLPLKSLDAGENYLGLGIADAVIRRISQTGELIVRPTSAVRRYLSEETDALAAARQLGVDSVLEGTVQHGDDRLRVSVNLLRTHDGASLWADSFDMRAADIFTIQDTISQQVASRLQLQLSSMQRARLGKRYTSNPEAYEQYAKGRANFEQVTTSIGARQSIDASISHFKKAVELDPAYALAHAALGNAYMWMANFNDPDNSVWVGQAQQSLSKAESLDPQLAEVHAARSEYYFSKYGNWDLAQTAREARQALALNPSVGHLELGTIYDHLGLDEATGLREFQRALEIDPTNTFIQGRLIESYLLFGKFDEAIETHRRFFGVLGPTGALIEKGRFDEAQPLLEEAVKKNSGDLRARARLALLIALRGKFQDAEAAISPILEQARNNRAYHHVTYDIACVYALAGKTDEAVKWLRTTAETGMPNYPLFARDPHLDRIRKETAFIQFMAEFKPRWELLKKEFEST